jgi:hypothetical protein
LEGFIELSGLVDKIRDLSLIGKTAGFPLLIITEPICWSKENIFTWNGVVFSVDKLTSISEIKLLVLFRPER